MPRRFDVTGLKVSDSLPIDPMAVMLKTLCDIKTTQDSMIKVLVEIRDAIKEGTKKADDCLEESKWIRLHMGEVRDAIRDDINSRQAGADRNRFTTDSSNS